jgi:hypothetical protein
MPVQKPGRSVQIVATPRELLDAVEARFGKITFDLAATRENAVVPGGWFYGPGSTHGKDALVEDWSKWRGNLWLNCEYGDIKTWAAKCFMTSSEKPRGHIFLLIPASVGSNWWGTFVDRRAAVYFLSPRVVFQGHTASYPKDIALVHFGGKPGYACWRWKP